MPLNVVVLLHPTPTPTPQGYKIDLVRDSQAVVIVEHSSETSPSGKVYNVYLSDSEGASYSLALEDLAYLDTGLGLRYDLEYVSEGRSAGGE